MKTCCVVRFVLIESRNDLREDFGFRYKAKRSICFLKESRVTLSFVVKSKLVTVLSLFPQEHT